MATVGDSFEKSSAQGVLLADTRNPKQKFTTPEEPDSRSPESSPSATIRMTISSLRWYARETRENLKKSQASRVNSVEGPDLDAASTAARLVISMHTVPALKTHALPNKSCGKETADYV